MTHGHRLITSDLERWVAALSAAALLVAAGGCSAGGSPRSSAPGVAASDPWTAAQLIEPNELAGLLKAPSGEKPLLLHVGFNVLYRAGTIPGSRYAGPGSRPEGIAALQQAVKDLPRDTSIVLYCGCCPWDHCPNMRPAFKAMRGMGFTNVRALHIAKNIETDWADRGFPLEPPDE